MHVVKDCIHNLCPHTIGISKVQWSEKSTVPLRMEQDLVLHSAQFNLLCSAKWQAVWKSLGDGGCAHKSKEYFANRRYTESQLHGSSLMPSPDIPSAQTLPLVVVLVVDTAIISIILSYLYNIFIITVTLLAVLSSEPSSPLSSTTGSCISMVDGRGQVFASWLASPWRESTTCLP